MSFHIDSVLIGRLEAKILRYLEQNPNGVSEYELLQFVRRDNIVFDRTKATIHALFQEHFLVFHILYRIREKLVPAARLSLEIGPLSIKIISCSRSDENRISNVDALAAFYLDIDQLYETTPDILSGWLDNFRNTLRGQQGRTGALTILGLTDPVTDLEIKKQYRRLAGRFHPDRYKSDDRLKEINNAYDQLIPKKSRR